MSAVVADTHAAVWYLATPEQLFPNALAAPDKADTIIAATALHLGLPLVTRDLAIQSASIETIW